MSGFFSRSSRALVLVGLAGVASSVAISNASAFGGMSFSHGGGGMMMHSMGGFGGYGGGMRPSWGGMRPIGGMGHYPSSPSIWGNHTTQLKLPPFWGQHPHPWHPGGEIASHCRAWAGCGSRPWHPGFPWHPVGYPWHPRYPVVVNVPTYTPVYRTPAYTAPVTYTAPAPAYTAPVTTPAVYAPPATYTAPAVATPAVAATCPTPDLNQQYVTVIFQSNASAVDTASFLKAYNVAVQDGPNQDGSFRLRVQTALPQDQLSQMIDSMKSQTAIVSQASAS